MAVETTLVDSPTTSLDAFGPHDKNLMVYLDVASPYITYVAILKETVPVGGNGLKPGIGGTVIKPKVVK